MNEIAKLKFKILDMVATGEFSVDSLSNMLNELTEITHNQAIEQRTKEVHNTDHPSIDAQIKTCPKCLSDISVCFNEGIGSFELDPDELEHLH